MCKIGNKYLEMSRLGGGSQWREKKGMGHWHLVDGKSIKDRARVIGL